MTDWRANGRKLLSTWEQRRSEEWQRIAPHVEPVLKWWDEENSFPRAVMAAFGVEQNREPLIALLRSEKAISMMDREWLADELEGADVVRIVPETLTRGRGAPPNLDQQRAARDARKFFNDWKRLNKQDDISDLAMRKQMLEESVEIVLKLHRLEAAIDPESILGRMRRGKNRQ